MFGIPKETKRNNMKEKLCGWFGGHKYGTPFKQVHVGDVQRIHRVNGLNRSVTFTITAQYYRCEKCGKLHIDKTSRQKYR